MDFFTKTRSGQIDGDAGSRPSPHNPMFSEKGFTLLDLIVVIAVIAILSGIALPFYYKHVEKAHEVVIVMVMNKVVKAEEHYGIENPEARYALVFDELRTTGLIIEFTGEEEGTYHDYVFTLYDYKDDDDDNCDDDDLDKSGNRAVWTITARPLNKIGTRKWFYADQNHIIRYEVGTLADSSSPPYQL